MIKALTGLLGLFVVTLSGPAVGESLQQFATNASYHSTRAFGSGVYDAASNKTFVVWAGAGMDIWVRGYDHGSNAWGTPNKVEDNNCITLNCYHNYPIILLAPNGKLRVVRFSHNEGAYILKAPTAGTSAGTWTESQFLANSELVGYPTAVVAGSQIYVFYRHTVQDVYRNLRFVKSGNSGDTWSTPKTVIDTGNAQSDGLNEVYPNDIGYESSADRIRLTWHLAGGAAHNEKTKHVYFAYLLPGSNDTLQSASGYSFGATIVADDFSNQDTRKLRVASVLYTDTIFQAVDFRMPSMGVQGGRPIVGFNKRVGLGGGDFESYRGYWDGSSWVVSRISANPGRVMDLQYINSTTLRALLTTYDGTRDNAVKALQTTNNGQTWSQIWSLSTVGQFINGADAINSVNTVNVPGSGIQAVIGTTDRSEVRNTDGAQYVGDYGMSVIRD